MRKYIIFIVAILILSSCSNQSPVKTGSLTLSAPRAISTTGKIGKIYTMRYTLTQDEKVIPLKDQSFIELSGSDSIQIDDLMPGPGYKLSLSVGIKENETLKVAFFGSSSKFSISEGTNSEVNISLKSALDFKYLTTSGSLASAIVINGNIYVLDRSNLNTFADTSLPPVATVNLGTQGFKINSLSIGKYFEEPGVIKDELWLNTSKGIYHKEGESFVSNMNTNLQANINVSNAVKLDTETIMALFSGGGTVVGINIAKKQEDFQSKWMNLSSPTEEEKKDYQEVYDLIDQVSRDLVQSFSVNSDNNESFYYASTPLGTVIGSMELKEKSFKTSPLTVLSPYMLQIGNGTTPITVVSTAGNRVMAGTDKGLYTDLVNTGDIADKKLGEPVSGRKLPPETALVTGTKGKKIVALESYKQNNETVLTVAITGDNSALIIKNNTILETLNSAVGLPENVSAKLYTDKEGFWHIIFTGSNGAIDYKPVNQ